MKRFLLPLLLMLLPLCAKAKWETFYILDQPISSSLVVERTTKDARYRIQFLYNYGDSTFRVRIYPTASMLFAIQELSHRYPARPVYVDSKFRFKGGTQGKQELTYRTYDTHPDIDSMVAQGYLEHVIKDDGRILSNLRDSKKMEVRYWDWYKRNTAALEVDTRDFEKTPRTFPGPGTNE